METQPPEAEVVRRARELVEAWRAPNADWVLALYALEDAVDELLSPVGVTDAVAAV